MDVGRGGSGRPSDVAVWCSLAFMLNAYLSTCDKEKDLQRNTSFVLGGIAPLHGPCEEKPVPEGFLVKFLTVMVAHHLTLARWNSCRPRAGRETSQRPLNLGRHIVRCNRKWIVGRLNDGRGGGSHSHGRPFSASRGRGTADRGKDQGENEEERFHVGHIGGVSGGKVVDGVRYEVEL